MKTDPCVPYVDKARPPLFHPSMVRFAELVLEKSSTQRNVPFAIKGLIDGDIVSRAKSIELATVILHILLAQTVRTVRTMGLYVVPAVLVKIVSKMDSNVERSKLVV